jgi:predicted metalloprotease
MKWRSGRRSQHVEDRRGRRVSGGLKIGGGLGGLLLILIILLMGGDEASAQRQDWLGTGLETGSLEACDTFARAGL